MPSREPIDAPSLPADPAGGSLLRAAGTIRVLDGGDAAYRGANALCAHVFLAAIERDGLVHVESKVVPRRAKRFRDLEALGGVALSWRVKAGHDAVLDLGGRVALLVSGGGKCEIVVAARARADARRGLRRLAAALHEEPAARDEVPVRFWTAGAPYAVDERRAIEAPEWDDVARNYRAPVRAALARLVAARGPGAGSVLLWHGRPGTGKTHALRALARAWRPWCSMHYVTDPERFLESSGYLMQVATAEPDRGETGGWRLVVLEDAGELVGASARSEVGQGLSRVLNLADGLLGQGVRCLLLITANEPVGRLHPALRRPGRCWAAIDFTPFGFDEALAWLARAGAQDAAPPRGGATLAELYALAEGRTLEHERVEAFGFARALTR
jgi:hypothetical protein